MKKSKQNFRSIWMKYQTVIIFAVINTLCRMNGLEYAAE